MVGALVLGSLPRLRRQGLAAGALLLALGLCLAAVALAPTVAAAVPLLVAVGALRSACGITFVTLVQGRAPANARGRVMALFMVGVVGLAPLSLGLAGAVGAAVGPRALLALGGAVVALAGLYALARREFRRADERPPP